MCGATKQAEVGHREGVRFAEGTQRNILRGPRSDAGNHPELRHTLVDRSTRREEGGIRTGGLCESSDRCPACGGHAEPGQIGGGEATSGGKGSGEASVLPIEQRVSPQINQCCA